MALPRSRRKSPPIIRVALLGVLGASSVALLLGYMLGAAPTSDPFTADEAHFVEAIETGTRYKVDFETWQQDPHHDALDIRSHPQQRCAALFYPFDPVGMAGCLQAIDPPQDGYRLPPR